MDIAQTRMRSTSSSSLYHAYKSHIRPLQSGTGVRPPSHRRPLRSVNENSALLRSPGPLESMLKKSTETGDIGIFSIMPGASPATYHQPARPRQCLADAGFLPSGTFKDCEGDYFPDEQKRLRSYRDTTSEIISLYCSDNQQYWMRPSSPIIDDGQRSFSLTTSSSRQIPSQKSSGTLQSHSSSSGLQRPRSPFPYPTRLKRPGVRPASPALAENGIVDYTRMVELDRTSQRTVHGSFKPTYCHGSKRRPPLSLRADLNRSTSSLPSRASPSPYQLGFAMNGIRTPSSSMPGLSRTYNRQHGGSTDHSVRSASLTSIVEMYQRPVVQNDAGQRFRPEGTFYYDYTEEFDRPVPLDTVMGTVSPLCPIPKRAGENSQPMVLRNDSQMSLDINSTDVGAARGVGVLDESKNSPSALDQRLSEAHRRHGQGHSMSSIDDVLNGADWKENRKNNSGDSHSPEEAGLTALVTGRGDSRSAPPISQLSITNVRVYGESAKAEPSTSTDKTSVGAWRIAKTLGSDPEPSSPRQPDRHSRSSLARLRCTLDPALAEFAALFSSFDRLSKSPVAKAQDADFIDRKNAAQSTCSGEIERDCSPTRFDLHSPLPMPDSPALEPNAYPRRHRRNVAALRINTAGLYDYEPKEFALTPPSEALAILSPKPISPARQLRVKNSIPRLMKALPPLPGDVDDDSEEDAVEVMDTTGHSHKEAEHSASLSSEGIVGADRLAERGPSTQEAINPGGSTPRKFKVRIRTSSSLSRTSEVGGHLGRANEQETDVQPLPGFAVKPKLKLKLSRHRLGNGQSIYGDAPLQGNRLKQCNSLADLAPRTRTVKYTHEMHLAEVVSRASRSRAGEQNASDSTGSNLGRLDPSPRPSDQFNIPYPPSADNANVLRSSTSTRKLTLSEMRSFNSDLSPAGHRGLRHKLSMLRLRFIGTATAQDAAKTGAGATGVVENLSDPTINAGKKALRSPEVVHGDAKSRTISSQSGKKGRRVRKWAITAKEAVRSYMRRTLDRSSRLSQ